MPYPRKPTKLKILAGCPGHKPINRHEPLPPEVESMPTPPAWLDKEAKQHWRKYVPMLIKLGVLTEADLGSWACACVAYSEVIHDTLTIAKEGRTQVSMKTGFIGPHPAVSQLNKALAAYKAYCSVFAMTPADRSRVKANGNDGKETPLEKLIRESKASRKAR